MRIMSNTEGRAGRPADLAPSRWAVTLIRGAKPFALVAASRAIVGRSRSRTDPTAGRFTDHDVKSLVGQAFDRFDREAPNLPHEPTVGSRQNVMLAALTLCLLEALQCSGVERGYAIELTGDVCWRFYRHWGRATNTVTGLISRDVTRRLRLSPSSSRRHSSVA
ncbi:MAG: hypothetical protein IVW52_20450 [Acidimicrobiales bacterium]|nr:hypothetical protein [Acidimicrobiales bacterium]